MEELYYIHKINPKQQKWIIVEGRGFQIDFTKMLLLDQSTKEVRQVKRISNKLQKEMSRRMTKY